MSMREGVGAERDRARRRPGSAGTSCSVIAIFAYLYGQWPTVAPRSASTRTSSPNGWPVHGCAVVNTAVADEGAVVEEADVGQELDRRLAVLAHDPLELDQVAAGVRVDGHVELARRVLALAQQRLAARLDLRRVEHPAQPPLRASCRSS